MALSLSKGGNLSLSKEDPTLVRMIAGLGWDTQSFDGKDFDLDASVLMLAANGKVRSDLDFIYYNQLKSQCGSVEHTGDNRTGEGDGDDEQIKIDLSKVPADVQTMEIVVTIHEFAERKQSFGQVQNAFVRIVNEDSGKEVARFDLSEDASTNTAMVFAKIYRHNGEWKFGAVAQGFNDGLGPLARQRGVNV